jgi:hypothetical protein
MVRVRRVRAAGCNLATRGRVALATAALLASLLLMPATRGPDGSDVDALAAATKPIIGTDDAAGWGAPAAREILGAHITWDRVELMSGSNLLATSLADGFKVLAIVNNIGDGTPLSSVNPSTWGSEVVSELKGNPGISLGEAANEAYFKGGVANPVQYGRMYLAAVQDIKAAGLHTPLLFDMTGDYPRGTWSAPTGWSEDAHGGGWLHDALAAVPGLGAAILANGVAVHPYGALGEDYRDEMGTASVAAQEALELKLLGAIPAQYLTEFGYALNRCGSPEGACSAADQATEMKAAYQAFLADPHVAGIWWYESHDDSTGRWGFMTRKNRPRKSFETLSAIAASAGQ